MKPIARSMQSSLLLLAFAGFLVWAYLDSTKHQNRYGREQCRSRLAVIGVAKEKLRMEMGYTNGYTPSIQDLERVSPHVRLSCPLGPHYVIGAIGEHASCSHSHSDQ